MWRSLVLLALLASAQGRAVNISNTWVLPEEGFPVFYRYFRDRISWYEADAVCQFHHANLVTVDTTAQYDAVRAYLRELDISSAVWVGLIRSNPDGDFTWTDYRGLSGDGYWSSAPDTLSAPLCAAANPAADYRWEARACGGPTVASFICELPVPQWALGHEGCMVRELPALTILYLPESAAVQLNADCGLAGVRRVQCTGYVKREGLLKDLSCADEEEISSTSTGTNRPITEASTTNQDTTSETTTEENTTVEHKIDISQPVAITATSIPQYINSKTLKSPTTFTDMNNFNTVSFGKDIHLGTSDDHNIQSNFIPKLVGDSNVLIDEQLEKLEDERHMQHKMLHEEIARVGNVDNIFTQPTDRFIPPLVMAKSRMSDDMTVLSIAEKHAQQIAEKQFSKHSQEDHSLYVESNKLKSENMHNMDTPLIAPIKSNEMKELKQNNLKSHVPKKYVNEKQYESKEKVMAKIWQSKPIEINKPTDGTQTTITTLEDSKTISLQGHPQYQDKIDEDFAMDLTVLLKDASLTGEENAVPSRYTGDVAKLETITKKNILAGDKLDNLKTSQENPSPLPNIKGDNNSMEHEVIQITVISNDDPAVNTTVFEITTKMPIFRDDTKKPGAFSPSLPTVVPKEIHFTESVQIEKSETTSEAHQATTPTTPVTFSVTSITEKPNTISDTTFYLSTTTETITTKVEAITTVTDESLTINKTEITEMPTTLTTVTFFNDSNEVTSDIIDTVATVDLPTDNHNDTAAIESHASPEKHDFNNTEMHDQLEKNTTNTEEIVYDDSPLLSGSYEPVQRPPRTRRPQEKNRKFNPFRILG